MLSYRVQFAELVASGQLEPIARFLMDINITTRQHGMTEILCQDLPRKPWVHLNQLRSGAGCFAANMKSWGIQILTSVYVQEHVIAL